MYLQHSIIDSGEILTTILAIRGEDGIVIAADTQATGRMLEYALKITPIGDNALLGCSGAAQYISLFTQHVQESLGNPGAGDYYKAVYGAIKSYSREVAGENEYSSVLDDTVKNLCCPAGVLAVYDSSEREYHIFEFQTPRPPNLVKYPNRASVGSGSLAADILLKNIERMLHRIGLDWVNLSTSLIAQFCVLLLRRIEYVDPATSGAAIYRLNQSRSEYLSVEHIFGKLGKDDYALTVLIRNAIKEIGPEKLQQLLKQYNLSSILSSLGLTLPNQLLS